jgi:hypothetical protein
MIVMRWLLGLLVMLLAVTPAQSDERTTRVKVYASVETANVAQWRGETTGDLFCEMFVGGLTSQLRFVWQPRSDSALMVVTRSAWLFPGDGIETPVEVFFDARKLGRDANGRPTPHITMRGKDDSLFYQWVEIVSAMEGVRVVRFRYLEGLAHDDRFNLPAIRLLLVGLKQCRAEIDAAPAP